MKSFINNPSQGLLLIGDSGSGKTTVLNWLAAKLLNSDLVGLDKQQCLLKINKDQNRPNISIDSIKQINHFLSLKVPIGNTKNTTRVITIDDADHMSIPAQNALLKNLEEPPINTIFLLTARDPNLLRPTIRSRIHEIVLTNPGEEELKKHLKSLRIGELDISKVLNMSGGMVGLASVIASDMDNNITAQSASVARDILQRNTYERLLMINDLQKNKVLSKNTLGILQQMANYALRSPEEKQSGRWLKVLYAANDAQTKIEANANLRLVLTSFMLQISKS